MEQRHQFSMLRFIKLGQERFPGWLWGVLLLVHILALGLYLNWHEILFNPPVADTDYATHWAEVWSVSHFLEDGRLSGYDPYFMAGHPEGTLFDIDNKLVEVASWLVSKSGFPLPLSYNIVLLAIIILSPLAIYPAARWLGLDRKESFLAQLIALALWFFDPALRWSWQGSTLTFAAAVSVCLLVLAAGVKLADQKAFSSWTVWLVWFGLGPLLFWLHAFSFFVILLPLTVLVLRRWPSLGWRRLAFVLWPPLVLAVNSPWVLPALRFAWARTSSEQFLQGGLPALSADLLGVGYVDGASTVSLLGLRWLTLIIGGLGLWQLAKRDAGALSVAVGAGTGLLLAYGAVHLPHGGNLQPYRYIEQAALWSTVGLGAGLRWLSARLGNTKVFLSASKRWVMAALAILALAWISNSVWRFRPPLLGGPSSNRWQGPSVEVSLLCGHLQTLPLEQGRVLIDDWRVGALLPWCSGAQVIGGHHLGIWTQYGYTNANFWDLLGVQYRDYTPHLLRSALQTYNVRWILAHQTWSSPEVYTLAEWLAAHPEEASPGPQFGPYQLYRVNSPPQGEAITVRADHTGIRVINAPTDSGFLLPYHWLPTLCAEPRSVHIQSQGVGEDPIPFIYVEPASDASFVIYDSSDCQ